MTLRLRSRLSEPVVLFVATALFSASVLPTVGFAAQPVIDMTSAGKLSEQLNSMREQTDKLTEITQQGVDLKNKVQDQINAIGKLGQVSLPMTNIDSLKRSVEREAMCLLPDISKIFPRISFKEFDLSSVCTARKSYSEALFFDLEKLEKTLGRAATWEDQKRASLAIDQTRRQLMRETSSSSLAAGHVMSAKIGPETRRSIDALEAATGNATSLQERLAISNKQTSLLLRQMERQNSILSEIRTLMALQLTALTSSAAETLKQQQKEGGP